MGGGHKSEEGRGLGLALALCAAIFFTDASHSATIPTFPFFASSLGASPSMIGALASVAGLSTMVSALPFGVLSDRLGRKRVMMLGVACFVAVPLLYLASRSPVHLLPARALLGVARASTFSIGFLFVSEVAP
jgi:MFS family permease